METICKLFLELSEVVPEECKTARQLRWGAVDFYRKMRICGMLFPEKSGNEHVAMTWGDVMDELQRRRGGQPCQVTS